MIYSIMMFIGGFAGLMFAGLNGALFGMAVGFYVGAWAIFSDENLDSFDQDTEFGIESDTLNFFDNDSSSNYHSINPASELPSVNCHLGAQSRPEWRNLLLP
jgi:hypothetical protein